MSDDVLELLVLARVGLAVAPAEDRRDELGLSRRLTSDTGWACAVVQESETATATSGQYSILPRMIGPVAGSMCLGVVIGWLIRYFLARFTEFNVRIFTSIVSVLCGGAIIKMFPDPYQYAGWFYPIGLLLGVILYPLISILDRRLAVPEQRPTRATKRAERRLPKKE